MTTSSLAPSVAPQTNAWAKRNRDLFPTLGKFNYLLTIRGFLILSFLVYLITGPVAQEADIVATVVSYAMLAALAISLAVTFTLGSALKKTFTFTVHPPSGDSNILPHDARLISGEPTLFLIRTEPVSIFPAFELQFQLEFDRPDISLVLHKLTGMEQGDRIIPEQITFPHRGIWTVSRATLSFGDQLGLTRFHWTLPAEALNQRFTLHPPRRNCPDVPVISSCHEAGDTLYDVHERRGDPFDLKQYHPSDGLKKIVWKIFAKSGQLVARHPEPSMTPEGEVAVFCLASRFDDHICSDVVSYLSMLSNLGLSIYFGSEGCNPGQIGTTPEAAEEMLIEHTWKTEQSTPTSIIGQLDDFVIGLRKALNNARIDSILVFCSSSRLWNESVLATYTGIGGPTRTFTDSAYFLSC